MFRISLPLLVFIGLVGCNSDTPLPPETDPAKGREALKRVLDSWKDGMTLEAFKNSKSGTVANDPDWAAGSKLTKYEVEPTDRRIGVDLLLTVTLFLTTPDGKHQEKTVNFSVGVGSQTVVLRKQ